MAPPLEVVVLIGLQGAGKSTLYARRFAATHAHVSKDKLRHHRRPAERQLSLIDEALADGRPVVVDNTNLTRASRAPLIAAARRRGARVVAWVLSTPLPLCLERNARREGKAHVPPFVIRNAARAFEPPLPEEGFDDIVLVPPEPVQ
jgi:predicted kinase